MSVPSSTLQADIEWVRTVLHQRVQDLIERYGSDDEKPLPVPPGLDGNDDPYAKLIREYELSPEERLILCLALLPIIGPELLDPLLAVNQTKENRFAEAGGAFAGNSSSIIPTGETAIFLLAGQRYQHRITFHDLLENKAGSLFRHHLIEMAEVPASEPSLSGRLYPTEEAKSIVLYHRAYEPRYNSRFPASLLHIRQTWDDLVISEDTQREIEEIKVWLRHSKALVNDEQIGTKIKPGYRSLFHGPSGTGKTLTASLLGQEARMPVYRIDLSLVVSKYIGETEKNLANIFDQAENRAWILFFDEADALFGKRVQTSNSNDRYANQEVSYLLQRIEDFPGLVILASNYKSNIDAAFVRRFQSMVRFSVPNEHLRKTLFQKAFRGRYQLHEDIDLLDVCRRYELSGANIHNVMRYCAMMTLENNDECVNEEIFYEGLRKELKKMGKTL